MISERLPVFFSSSNMQFENIKYFNDIECTYIFTLKVWVVTLYTNYLGLSGIMQSIHSKTFDGSNTITMNDKDMIQHFL